MQINMSFLFKSVDLGCFCNLTLGGRMNNLTHSFASGVIADYFLALANNAGNTLTPMQINKLVYIAHGFFMGYTGNPLIKEPIEAWQYGPVVASLYHRFKGYGGQAIYEVGKMTHLPDVAETIITQVYEKYGNKNGIELSGITHKDGTPWSLTYNGNFHKPIGNDLIQSYYEGLLNVQR